MPPEQFLDVRHPRKAFQSLSVVFFRSPLLLGIDLDPGILLDEDYLEISFLNMKLVVDLFKNSECKIGIRRLLYNYHRPIL